MNVAYKKDYAIWLEKIYRFYRLSRSIRRRDIHKIFGVTEAKMPDYFFAGRCSYYDYGKRSTFHYNETYVRKQNENWNIRHSNYFVPYRISRKPNIREADK